MQYREISVPAWKEVYQALEDALPDVFEYAYCDVLYLGDMALICRSGERVDQPSCMQEDHSSADHGRRYTAGDLDKMRVALYRKHIKEIVDLKDHDVVSPDLRPNLFLEIEHQIHGLMLQGVDPEEFDRSIPITENKIYMIGGLRVIV